VTFINEIPKFGLLVVIMFFYQMATFVFGEFSKNARKKTSAKSVESLKNRIQYLMDQQLFEPDIQVLHDDLKELGFFQVLQIASFSAIHNYHSTYVFFFATKSKLGGILKFSRFYITLK
jgi:hypothetical protein